MNNEKLAPTPQLKTQNLKLKTISIGVVVGETSGDNLGYAIIKQLQQQNPNLKFSGMGGDKMQKLGFNSLFDCHQIAYIGLVDPLLNLRKILNIRKQLYSHFLKSDIKLFIGIDAPDFNFGLEKQLHSQGVKIVHFVSPQLWAWRKGRAKKIAKFIDLMLLLFKFEQRFYKPYNLDTKFVGHPLADKIPLTNNKNLARKQLKLANSADKIIAVLPGSRDSEVKKMLPIYLKALEILQQQQKFTVLMPLLNEEHKNLVAAVVKKTSYNGSIKYVVNQIAVVLAAADFGIVTSGTASLECMFYKLPMVVAYRTNAVMYYLLKPFVKPPFFSLPNLISEKKVIPELIQNSATAETIAKAIQKYFDDPQLVTSIERQFMTNHQQMRQNSAKQIAASIIQLIAK